MKVLIVGDWHSDLHEEELLKSFIRLGYQASSFKWFEYLQVPTSGKNLPKGIFNRFQSKFLTGPAISAINRDLRRKAFQESPDIIFVYRGSHILPRTLSAIKSSLPTCRMIGYNNDDPFSPRQPRHYWRHFVASIPIYDLVLAYRLNNLCDYSRAGAQSVDLLRSWYVPDRNYPLSLSLQDNISYQSDVVFVGHYENDGRLEYLEEVVRKGFRLRIFGPPETWVKPLKRSAILQKLHPVRKVWGKDYNKALSAAKVALCFLSKLNRDTYTRRCFEIPATKTVLFSEFTEDLAAMYLEGSEAVFFRGLEDFSRKLISLLDDNQRIVSIAEAGYQRAVTSGYDIDSRISKLFKAAV